MKLAELSGVRKKYTVLIASPPTHPRSTVRLSSDAKPVSKGTFRFTTTAGVPEAGGALLNSMHKYDTKSRGMGKYKKAHLSFKVHDELWDRESRFEPEGDEAQGGDVPKVKKEVG